MSAKPLWTAEENANYKTPDDVLDGALSGHVLRYHPNPGGTRHPDGRVSLSMTFPVLALTSWVSSPQVVAEDIARKLNSHSALLDAAKAAKAHLVPDLVEPGRTVFWQLVEAIKAAEPTSEMAEV